MDTFYIDWAHSFVVVLKNNKLKPEYFKTLFEFLDTLSEPARIILEATFESFFRDTRRTEFILRAEAEGHTLLTTPTKQTGKFKVKRYPPEKFPQYYTGNKFPDELAVGLIRDIAKSGMHLSTPRIFNEDEEFIRRVREPAKREIVEARYTKVDVGRANPVTAKELLAKETIASLPPYKTLPTRLKNSLGNGKEYSTVLVGAVTVMAKYVKNTREFDRLSGLYAHGYGSQFRSDLHYWGMKWAIKRHGDTKDVRRDFRYAIRWLYHQISAV